jgi:hypothetical protein
MNGSCPGVFSTRQPRLRPWPRVDRPAEVRLRHPPPAPLGVVNDDETLIYLPTRTQPGSAGHLPMADGRPGLATTAASQLLRDALQLKLRSGAGPFRSFGNIAVEPRAYQLVPLLMALKQDRAAADRRRRRYRQDHRRGADRPRTARPRRDPAHGRAVPAPPVRAVAARAGRALSHPCGCRAHQLPPAGWSATCLPAPVGVRCPPVHRRQPRLHQVRAPARRAFQRCLPGVRHRRRGAHLHPAARANSSATPAQGPGRGRISPHGAAHRHPPQRR